MDEHASFEPQPVLAERRERANRYGILVAGLAIAATVAVGVFGTRNVDERAPDGPTASAASSAVAIASAEPRPSLANVHPATLPQYPGKVLGLQVWSAAYVSKFGLEYYSGTIAVSGWFIPEQGSGCPTPRVAEDPALAVEFGVAADPDTFCERTGDLFTAPMYGENSVPIAVRLPPGVPAPYSFDDVAIITPVVLVGRLTNAGTRCRVSSSCGEVLVVDRVAWASGAGVPRTASVLPNLLDHWPPVGSPARDRLVAKAVGDTGEVLVDALVDPATLARIDPNAAQILEVAAPKAERIWYRRILGAVPDRDPVLWVAIDDATGNVIGSGPVTAVS